MATKVMRADSPQRAELEANGWSVAARSFGARLDADRIDESRLRRLVEQVAVGVSVRPLDDRDVDAVLALDSATGGDYPGSVATRHALLDREGATPTPARRGFGAFGPDGELVAMTFVDVETDGDGSAAETDFTVVHRAWRRRGLAVAVKAASVLALSAEGVTRFRTGGSADNAGIIRANTVLGYVRDEEWITLERAAD
ncbi:acetyltransferase [Frigoribacterium sp. CFBP 13712]|uniref:acetyltransferase n=1 Tax=Frigoribacterium sp. CFBP 13712 TaxID=2775309 RepID=UPI0017846C36|nr:acetyltransferase [Frigoribacterium sp. CFBP 13712]MBD8704554.1 acetyltransferase [Frigoribacterium sp. CFBP 13712]